MLIDERIAELWRSIRHNPFFCIAFVVLIILLLWIFGCEPTTTSPFDPTKKVTRAELQIDFDATFNRVELANNDLTRKEQLRGLLLNGAFLLAGGDEINPVAMLTTAFSILGIGSVLDNRRKDRVIEAKSEALTNADKKDA